MKWKIIIVTFFTIMFLYGITNITDYGRPWDEGGEINILRQNLKEYALAFGESQWSNYYEDMHIQAISQSVEKDHGESPYYFFVPVMYIFQNCNSLIFMYLWHLYTFVFFFLGVIALFFLINTIYDSKMLGLLASAMYYFSPRIFGEGHYNNKDMMLLTFGIFTLCFGVRMIRCPKWHNIIMFAFSAATATNIKIIGAWFFACIGVFFLADLIFNRKLNRKTFGYGVGAFLTYILFYLVITPASWSGFFEYIYYCLTAAVRFARWGSSLVFEGTVYQPIFTGLPWYYVPKWILMTTPEYIILLWLISNTIFFSRILKREFERKDFYFLVLTIAYLVPLLYTIFADGLILYNGWRHFYFLYGPILACGIYAIDFFVNSYIKYKTAIYFGVWICIAVIVVDMTMNRSYEYTYFNFLCRGQQEENYEIDYWNVAALRNISEFVNEQYDGVNKLKIGSTTLYGEVAIVNVLDLFDEDMRNKFSYVPAEEADYLYFNTSEEVDKSSMNGLIKIKSFQKYENEIAAFFCR